MSKRKIQPAPNREPPVSPGADAGISSTMENDSELLLLALLEQVHADRAAGRYRDLTVYYAANPELADAFLEMALAAVREEHWEEHWEAVCGAGLDSLPLSPGVRRALASIPEFAVDSTDGAGAQREHRRVAENTSTYRARNDGKRS